MKGNNREIAPILKRKTRFEHVIELAEKVEQARAFDGKVLVGGRRCDYGQGSNRFELKVIPPRLRNLLGSVIVYGIVKSFFVNR